MGLTQQQVDMLVKLAASTSDDDLDCDGCFVQMAEFAEAQLMDRSVCESMQLVEVHLRNCPCCKDEFEALKAALGGMTDSVDA